MTSSMKMTSHRVLPNMRIIVGRPMMKAIAWCRIVKAMGDSIQIG